MVSVKKPKSNWKVQPPVVDNRNCPFLYYPLSYTACGHSDREHEAECNENECPIKVEGDS